MESHYFKTQISIQDKNRIIQNIEGEFSKHFVVLKVGLSPSKKIRVICFIESPLKMMKNTFFISSLKLFSFSRYLGFCNDLLVMLKKRLD